MGTHVDGFIGGLHEAVDLVFTERGFVLVAGCTVSAEKAFGCLAGCIDVADIIIGEHNR